MKVLHVLDHSVPLTTQKHFGATAQVVAATCPDPLQAHSRRRNGIAAIRFGQRQGLPVFGEIRAPWDDAAADHGATTEGSLSYRLSRGRETWTRQRACAVATACQGLRGGALRRGDPQSKVTVIPNALVLGRLGSLYGIEGLSTLIEALPPVLPRKSIRLFNADDAQALAAKIVVISMRRDQLVRVTRQAREFVKTQGTRRVSVGGYRGVYESVQAARRSP